PPPPPAGPFTVNIVLFGPSGAGSATIYPGGPQYPGTEITITVATETGYRLVGGAISVPGPGPTVDVTTVTPNTEFTFDMPARVANVHVNFEEIPPPPDPYRDLAFGADDSRARASNIRAGASYAISNAFNNDWNNFAHIAGAVDLEHWFAVDLGLAHDGQPYEIQVVRVGWGLSGGATGDHNGMVNFALQVSTTLSGLPAAQTYDDDGWTTVRVVNNPGNDGINVRNLQNRLNVITLDPPVPARFVRIKQLPGLDAGAPPAADRPWTNWPAVSIFQVFATDDVPPLSPPVNAVIGSAAERVTSPVWGETPPAIDTDFAPTGAAYTARLTGIAPAVTGTFSPGQVYTFTFALQANEGTQFNTVPPTIFRTTPAGAQATTIVSVNNEPHEPGDALVGPIHSMVVTHAFPATESNLIGGTLVFAFGAPYSYGVVPTADDLAPDGAPYSGTLVIYESEDGVSGWTIFEEDYFGSGKYYRFVITLEADEYFEFYEGIIIPAIAGINATGIQFTAGGTVLSFTYNFEATEGPREVTITGATVTGAGLTAVARLIGGVDDYSGYFARNQYVYVQITVTGEATGGTIYVARLASEQVGEFVFVRGDGVTSSAVATRNIGPEVIPSATQTAGNWTFDFRFVMPGEDAEISLVNTFRTDIAPHRPNAGPETAMSSNVVTGRLAYRAFNGEYALSTTANIETRWEHGTAGPGSATWSEGHWVMVDLGAEYHIEDIVLRGRNNNAFPRIFQIFAATDPEVWEQMYEQSGEFRFAYSLGRDHLADELILENDLWNLVWDVTITTDNLATEAERVSFVPLFVSETNADGSYEAVNLHTAFAPNANGPFVTRPGLPSTGRYVRHTPQTGRFVLMFITAMGNEGNTGNFGVSFLNFEIYGTPVAP
ncbi:MAG: discoidin domain-containing protein, partial [Treponema sp.]|nr:discoidin domain-containing protein [Treponema sp.]